MPERIGQLTYEDLQILEAGGEQAGDLFKYKLWELLDERLRGKILKSWPNDGSGENVEVADIKVGQHAQQVRLEDVEVVEGADVEPRPFHVDEDLLQRVEDVGEHSHAVGA